MTKELSLYPAEISPIIRTLCTWWYWPRRFMQKYRDRVNVDCWILGHRFIVPPTVFNPKIMRSGRVFASFIQSTPLLKSKSDADLHEMALDVGTGSGVLAIFAALRGYTVTAVDINPIAVKAAKENIEINGIAEHVDIFEGDLFDPVQGQQFDLVLCSLPKFRGRPETTFELGWKSETVIQRFADGLPAVLKDDGLALIILTDHGDDRGMIEGLMESGLDVTPVHRRHMGVEIMTIYAVRHT